MNNLFFFLLKMNNLSIPKKQIFQPNLPSGFLHVGVLSVEILI